MENLKNNDLMIIYNAEPKKQNVFYAFQRLITALSIASKYDVYQKDSELVKRILDVVIDWAIKYEETANLECILPDEIADIKQKLYNLDGKYLSEKGLHFEEAYEWIIQLGVLIKNYNMEDDINGI